MSFLASIASPFLNLLKKLVQLVEFKRYKDALRRNPQDHHLRARFAKYCLNSYFQDSTSKFHVVEAVNQFENIVHSDVLDLEVFYLMGKFYQGQDNKKAMDIYKQGIKRYNDFVTKSVEFRHEHVETAFAIALNLLALESNHADPELEKFFKTIRRTYLKNFLEHKVDFNPEILGNTSGIHPITN
jgi:mRNA-degrading endonuclease RelE of RelBE toxin-antitoxin system